MARILSVWCPNWPITTWRRRTLGFGALADAAYSSSSGLALVASEAGTRRIVAVDEVAMRLGLQPGQKVADALALARDLVTAEHEPAADRAALEALCDWCVRFSCAVAIDGADGLFLDITGTDHLWGGEATLLADLIARLARWGVPAQAAIADTPGAAWALARFGANRPIAPPNGQRALLADLPVAALRLDETATVQLPRLGLYHIGQLLGLPRAQLAKRFGLHLTQRLDQALGAAGEALAFRRPVSPWFARLAFAEPISTLDDLARATADITALICRRLEAESRGARRFEVVFHRLDGKAMPVRAGLARAGRDAVRLTRLLVPKLDVIDPGFGIEVVTVFAGDVEPLSATQVRLDSQVGAGLDETLAPLIDRLVNRLGEDRVWRADPHQSHVPERAVIRRAPLTTPLTDPAPATWDPERPRPVRLFRHPEAIIALAKVPDDPPVQFTWRGRSHRIRRAEGPERIGQEWWRADFESIGPGRVRDYYRVEDEAGGRFWIFRQGLFGTGDAPPKWWIHGLFG